jgi:ferric-chelate reductase
MLIILEKLSYCLLVDIAEILLGWEGSDIGVVVCGPRKMRHEVAEICSTSLAKNLHLEPFSFNW